PKPRALRRPEKLGDRSRCRGCRARWPRRETTASRAAPGTPPEPESPRLRLAGPPASPRRRLARRAATAAARPPPHLAAAPTARADTRAAKSDRRARRGSSERRDLGEELRLLDRLHDVVARALAQPPDAVRLLTLACAQDDRNALRALVARQRARCLKAVLPRQHHIHEHEIRRRLLDLDHGVFGALGRRDAEAVLRQHFAQELTIGR